MSSPKRYFRLNQNIVAPEFRVLDDKGNQLGVFRREDALKLARDKQLDLVEIAPKAKPPVVKLINFKKFLYLEEKKKRQERKKTKVSQTKEIRLGPFTNEHDLATKVASAAKFLNAGDKLRIVVKFAGRQIVHPEFGHRIMQECITRLSNFSKLEREPHLEGKLLIAVLTPRSGKKANAKTEN